MGKKFMVIDGNSLANRAYYAIPLLTTSKGVFTNAVYGFVNMLMRIMDEEKPDYIAVAFDKGRNTFRNIEFSDYKAHRKGMPEELRPQFPVLKEVLEAMNIAQFEMEGFEADDLIGTLTAKAEAADINNIIVTGDRDALQLVSDKTRTYITRKGITELEIFDVEKIKEKYGFEPIRVIDLKGLMGDSSDNIPGIPGVGEKTAIKLLQEYGCVEELLENAESIKGKLGEKIRDNKDLAIISKRLATIVRDIPLEIEIDVCKKQTPDYHKLLQLFTELEFKGLVKNIYDKISEESSKNKSDNQYQNHEELDFTLAAAVRAPLEIKYIHTKDELDLLGESIKKEGVCALWVMGNKNKAIEAQISHLAITIQENTSNLIDLNNPENRFTRENVEEFLQGAISADVKIITHDAKGLILMFRDLGINVGNLDFDTMIAAYLINPAKGSQDLGEVVYEHLKDVLPDVDVETKLVMGVEAIWRLKTVLRDKLIEDNLEELFNKVELPLAIVLAEMEWNGVRLDVEQLKEMSLLLGEGIDKLTQEIYELAGEAFNINSPKQLGVILFEKLELPVVKKTKTGYSTDAEVLETLAEEHDIVEKILEYRQLVKLKSTYVDGLTSLISPKTGKVHTTFNQTITATGRLSSTEPNLQNIPIRLELGRKIRKVFVPERDDSIILAADYSQIELRVLAHISKDPTFIKSFEINEDIHTRTASEVFGVPLEDVTKEMRSRAKAVNFGIVYGISDFGLGRDIKVSRKEAKQYIEKYFDRYQRVKEYMDEVISTARDKGYVTTILNRRRYLPDLISPNRNIRNFGERTAMNTPIQGSAADIIKVAMINVYNRLILGGYQTKMLLQVHDELIFQVPKDELDIIMPLIKEEMEKAVKLVVPVVVDVKVGANWYDMEKVN